MMASCGVKVVKEEYTNGDCALKTSMNSSQSSSATTPIHYPASMEVDVVDGIEFLAWETLDELNRYCVKPKYLGKDFERSNGPQVKRKRPLKSKKTSLTPKQQKVKHEIYTEVCNPIISTHRLECLYNEYIDETLREEARNKPKYILSPTMDENHVNNSLRALDSSLIKSRSTMSTSASSTIAACNEIFRDSPRLRYNNGINCNIKSTSTTTTATATIKKEKISPEEMEDAKINADDHLHVASPGRECEADITEMISRHSKREIRLPARYHQSGFLMGTQWIIPDYESSDKTAQSKRLKIEENNDHTYSLTNHQNSSVLPTSSSPSSTLSTCSYYLIKPLNSCENQRLSTSSKHSQATATSASIPAGKRSSATISRNIEGNVKRSISTESVNNNRSFDAGSEMLNKVNACKNNPSHSYQLKLHQEKLDKIQKLKQLGVCDGSKDEHSLSLTNNSNTKGSSSRESCKKLITYSRTSASSPSRHSSTSCSASAPSLASSLNSSKVSPIKNDSNNNMVHHNHTNNSVTNASSDSNSKDAKLKELREAYRLLFFENKPERKQDYQRTRIKPRVNKKAAVEEAIKTIETLTKRQKTLEYIKKVLTMWNRKLTIAAKVIDDKGKILSD